MDSKHLQHKNYEIKTTTSLNNQFDLKADNCFLQSNVNDDKVQYKYDYTKSQEENFDQCVEEYHDVIYSARSYDERDVVISSVCRHVARHVTECYEIVKANEILLQEKEQELYDSGEFNNRVLIIVPTRNAAKEYGIKLYYRLRKHFNVSNKSLKLFKQHTDDQFVDNDAEDKEEFDEMDKALDCKTRRKRKIEHINNKKIGGEVQNKKRKLVDCEFQEFMDGNVDDNFIFGLSLRNKSNDTMEFTTIYPICDIVIASVDAMMDMMNDKHNYESFGIVMSSVELLVIDQTDYLLTQYPRKLPELMAQVNECKLTEKMFRHSKPRVYPSHVKKQAKFYRQTILLSNNFHDNMRDLLVYMNNYRGINIMLRQDAPITTVNRIIKLDTISRHLSSLMSDMSSNDGPTVIYFRDIQDLTRMYEYMYSHDITNEVFSDITKANRIHKKCLSKTQYILVHERFFALSVSVHMEYVRNVIFYRAPNFTKFIGLFKSYVAPHNGKVVMILSDNNLVDKYCADCHVDTE